MSTLTIRGVPDELHKQLKERAERSRRSLNAETLLLLEQAVYLYPEDSELRERFAALGDVADTRRAPSPDAAPGTPGPAPDAADVMALLRDRRHRLRALGVRRIGLFGSVLRGEARHDSDLDLLVEFDPAEKTYDRFLSLASYLEELLGRPVDLVTTEGLSPYIGPRILEEAEFVTIDG